MQNKIFLKQNIQANRFFLRLTLMLPIYLFPISSWGWSRLGHETVATIAEKHLNPATVTALQEILGNKPVPTPLASIALCADDIKYKSISCGEVFAVPRQEASKPWHYIDIPIGTPFEKINFENYCPQDSCVLKQIPLNISTLKNSSASLIEKQFALMFLVHFVGDLHQPLHCAEGKDSLGENDQGGNLKTVHFTVGNFTRKMSLHELWDKLIQKPDAEQAVDAQILADSLDKDWSQQKGGLPKGDWNDYAVESFRIADTLIYPNFEKNLGQLELDYQSVMQPIAYRQIMLAGLRLAETLNAIYGSSGTNLKEKKPFKKSKDHKIINSLGQDQKESLPEAKKNHIQILFKSKSL